MTPPPMTTHSHSSINFTFLLFYVGIDYIYVILNTDIHLIDDGFLTVYNSVNIMFFRAA